MSLFSSARYANVVATLALVVAVGGTSYAAATITGKDVKDGSLTGKDLKQHSVAAADLKGPLPGTLKGYAHVDGSGVLLKRGSSKVVVTGTGNGFTCLNYTGGTPRSVQATLDLAGADSRGDDISASLDPDVVATYCGSPGADVVVATIDASAVSGVTDAFFLAIVA